MNFIMCFYLFVAKRFPLSKALLQYEAKGM